MAHPVVHFEIGGADGDALATFYGKLFDWKVEPAGPDYWMMSPGDGSLAGGILQTTGDMPSYVTLYVAVEDLDVALKEAEALGGIPQKGPTDIPGVGAFALFLDPAGNLVGLLRPDVT